MRITRWTPRAVARIAASALVVSAMSLALNTASSASERAADATTDYVCAFPSGDQRVPVKISATFPAAATAGRSVRPRDVSVTPTLPQAALADLTGLGATSVTASAELSVTVAQHGRTTSAVWSGLAARSTPVPASGDLTLTASGSAPPVPVEPAGAMVFAAGPLTLVLTPHRTGGGATTPATVPLNCRLALGPATVLATVPVTAAGGGSTGVNRPKAGSRTATPADDDPCQLHNPLDPVPGEAYLAGFSNVKKLGGATLIGREDGQTTGHATLELNYDVVFNLCPDKRQGIDLLSRGMLEYHGKAMLPPVKATFLSFGFTPTTATLEMRQVPGTQLDIDTNDYNLDDGTEVQITTVTQHLIIHIRDVRVNGVPLDVGPHCESATPMTVGLSGRMPDYTVNGGGPLTGTVTIPPFAGCGVGENLDPLFTGSISGPGNYMKLMQGIPCTRPPDDTPQNCDPIDRPDPQP